MRQDIGSMGGAVRIPGPGAHPPPRRLSRVMHELADQAREAVSVEDIRAALGDRSFAALLLFFSSINLLPLPPGASVIFGMPMIIVAFQLAAGAKTVWLPRFLLAKSLSRSRFQGLRRRAVPWIERLETIVRPRYWPFSRAGADRVVGTLALILSIAVALPVPFGNWLPALATCTVALALMERDGVVLGIGLCIGALALAVIGVVIGAAGALAALILA